MSSLKMTFSLTSLIFLIALGLVFVPTSVMAHPDASSAVDTPRPHGHPLHTALAADEGDGGTGTAVAIHGDHPEPTISLKSHDRVNVAQKEVVITADDAATTDDAENTFDVMIGFSMLVDDDSTSTAAATDISIAAARFNIIVRDKNGKSLTTGTLNATISDANRGTDSPAATDPIMATVTLPAGLIPTGSGDMEYLTIELLLVAGTDANPVAYSLQVDNYVKPDLSTVNIPGGHSVASAIAKFKLVQRISDDVRPTVEIEVDSKDGNGKHALKNGNAVFKLTFSEPLAKSDDTITRLQTSDFSVTRHMPDDDGVVTDTGTVIPATDLTLSDPMADDDKEVYTLTVEAGADPQEIRIVLDAAQVGDPQGNTLAEDAMSTFDTIPPRVTITAPSGPLTAPAASVGDLRFTFDFSEPIENLATSDLDRSPPSNYTLTERSDPQMHATDNTVYTIDVTPKDPTKKTTVRLIKDSVTDAAMNPLPRDEEATFTPDTPGPEFVSEMADIAVCDTDDLGTGYLLPKASDEESDELTYTLMKDGTVVPNLTAKASPGLYWKTVERENRYLMGIATTDDAGTYTWMVTDDNDNTDSLTFEVMVKELQKPEKPTDLKAEKVDSESERAPTQDRVKLNWDVPESKRAYPDCIPDVDRYTVMAHKYDEVMEKFVAHTLAKSTFTVADDINKVVSRYSLALEKLDPGIYQFTIKAHNAAAADSDPSDNAIWTKTNGTRVVVAAVPAAPMDLRAAVENGVYATVNWLKVPDSADGGAPIHDDPDSTDPKVMQAREKFYGSDVTGDYAGYVLYQVNQATREVTEYKVAATGTLSIANYNHPTTRVGPLAPGEYVFRATAMNIAGESERSLSTPYAHVRIVTTADTRPEPPPVGQLPSDKVVDADYNASTGVTSLASAGSLAANDFAVINAIDLPDIQRFFAEGGTLTLLNTSGAKYDIAISEIMWGLNLAKAIGAGRDAEQFIELYNTTAAAIDLSTVTIVFHASETLYAVPTGSVLLDQISNVVGGWVITDAPGQSGSIPTAGDPANTPSVNLISMSRNIDYDKVEKTDHNADATKNREAQLKDFPDGNKLDKWTASNAADTYGVNRIGSPGSKPFKAFKPLTPSTVDRAQVIINEIGNHSDDKYDWLELRNVSSGEVNLKKWELSQVTDDKKDTQLVSFPDNDNHKIPAGGVLLIVNSDPYRDPDHPIAAGTRINTGNAEGTGTESRYYVDSNLKLKNSGKTLLILRSANDKEGKPEALKDVVGTLSIVDNAVTLRTSLWPLVSTGAPHGNVIDGTDDEDFRAGKVYKRNNAGGGTGEKHLGTVGYTGVGYKRSAAKSGQNGGTPGYANDAVKVNEADLADATVSISEIMYDRGNNLPQWIELYNSSMTQAVNLNEWKLKIEHSRDVEDVDIRYPAVTTNNLGGGIIIQPNQTVLIVSTTTGRTSRASQGRVDFPATRIINLWGQKDRLEVVSGKTRRNYRLLSVTAFKLTLMDKSGAAVDVVGNLGADGTAMWDLPMAEDGIGRSSIIRRYDAGEPRDGTMAPSGDGQGPWVLASDSPLADTQQDTYYGSADDISTPGYRGGGALPVSLSKFRPERLESGEIVVRWITESELNNAGFNILRSEKRDGEFTKINTSLIAGQGTTSEQTTYEWKDTTAKPNVVYYYQIQDVSLDGKVQTLRQSRLKGDISAAGKLTTTWGELKALQ